ncbi:hypothetical protein EPUL_000583 [Erysiphe pulchra]|uniref:Actin interacting protein 3 C-terminal domain-containing protein n=1 Tax=Erysiphe pulchra TaxID=225359 RepID=A0A2S4Q0S2_9PEZI|nr:hypothetical protein EPUL_000583 [Erysiphe pulchra]
MKPISQRRTSNSSKKSRSSVRKITTPSQTHLTSQPTSQSISIPNSELISPSISHPISQLISQPISQIEKSVSHVFVAAKQLLETLKKWSQLQASNVQVSDIYLRLGNEFNLACRVLTAIDINTSDLGKFLVLLRTVLKITLSQEPSAESLETYLPRIQEIIIRLLHGLKTKQQDIRRCQNRNVKGFKSKLEKISTGSGIITNLGSFTVDNSPIKNNTKRNTDGRASTSTNNVVIYHNISTSFLRTAQPTQDQAPLDTTKEENFPILPTSVHVSSKNALATVQKIGNLNTQDSRSCSTDQFCNQQRASPTNCLSINTKLNQIENLSLLENKKESLSSSPQPTEVLTLFLQYKTKVKKFLFSGGCSALTVAKLQQVFIEKFAWNTHHNGINLPEIYIQDPKSGTRHELEDLSDIKDRSVLVLNVEALDEVKRQIDDSHGGMKKMMENIQSVVDNQQATIQRVSDHQKDTATELFQIQTAISSMCQECNYRTAQKSVIAEPSRVNTLAYKEEVQAIRRDISIFRESFALHEADLKKSLNAVRKLSENSNATALKACLSEVTNDHGRKYVNDSKKSINEECDKIIAHVDDLQDTVEDLRKDVALRGVQPHPRQLEAISKDMELAVVNLKKMKVVMKREKLIWTETWKIELERVCNDQEDVNKIEDLIQELEDDVAKTSQIFALIEEATKERSKYPEAPKIAGRAISRGFSEILIENPAMAKEGVLDEVRALLPNHEDRLEAIERAEKLRARELKIRNVSEFEVELEKFVEEGKLRKSGGYEEVERIRQMKDERIRQNTWDKMNGTIPLDAGTDVGIVDNKNLDDKILKIECEDADEG